MPWLKRARSLSRLLLVLFLIANLIMAWATLGLEYLFLPWLWASWFLLASFGTVWALLNFTNKWALSLAGAATSAAFAMRGFVYVKSWVENSAPSLQIQNLATGCVVYFMISALTVVVFVVAIIPTAQTVNHRLYEMR